MENQQLSVFWLAIIISAIIFGLGHLPITGTITPITHIIVARAIILNGIGGIIFGWLYWKKGLELAMISHFSIRHYIAGFSPVSENSDLWASILT